MSINAPLTTHLAATVIETDRLRLRPHQLGDAPDCVAMWADPEVARFTIGDPSPAPRTWQRILGYRGHWPLLGFGYWAVEERATGRYVGDMGFADFRRGLYPAIDGMPELGWALAAHVHGKGYAGEALRAIASWGDKHFGSLCTACIIHRDNHRSFRVADKLGFRAMPSATTADDVDVVLIRTPHSQGGARNHVSAPKGSGPPTSASS
jgi:RimJ/RimL family protein N-acetyltransferase